MKRYLWCLALLLPGVTAVAASPASFDWPQWQGPDRNAMSKETGLLKEWPEVGPPLAWRIEGLGGGYSAPSIAAGRIFGMSNRDGDEVVWALSETDGKTRWTTRLGPAYQGGGPQGKEGPACAPTVDGERLYVVGAGGDLVCLQADDGKVVWKRSFTNDFGGRVPMWRFAESPLIDGDKLIGTPGGPDAMLVALDKLTGETIWKSQVPSGAQGAPPAVSAGPGSPGGSPGGGADRGSGGSPGSRPGGGFGAPAGGPGGAPGGGSAPAVSGTKDPGLFVGEHWGMSGFSCKIPNGKYLAKLYFAETYAGITGPGQRVFSYNVQGREFKDFDIWAKAGGPRRAYVETVPVEVTDGEFRIVFTRQVENPAINAIEIVPQADPGAGAAAPAATIRIKAGLTTPLTDSSGQVWQPDQGFEGGGLGGMMQIPGGFAGGQGGPRGSGRSPGGFGGFGGRPGGVGGRTGGFGGSGASYASAIAIDFDGQRQYVQLTANALIGVAAADGKFLWRYDRPANRMAINCSTPVFQDGLVFASSAYGNGGGAVKLSKDASGAVKAEEVYFTTRMQNHHGGMIVVNGCLYGASGGNEGGFLACLDFQSGELLWRDREAPKGSLAMADGRLYLRTEEGAMLLIEPNRERLVTHGRFDQPDRTSSPAWTHPVIANGKLYLRDQDLLLCYDIKAQ
ncbi:MAG: PQQ-binding-like beta-propeller repeat protein [Pirellulaceae bacterium]|nr:PQQ-binding-like beta-propeller repeat protein [Pirellulaceae bacterium]